MKEKGFTLIELLAIIVILAIIAVITIPQVSKTIEDSKKNATKDSAYGYKNAVHQYYLNKSSEDGEFDLSGSYDISNGVINDGVNSFNISTTGDVPKSGSVTVEDGEIVDGCINYGKYSVVIENGNVTDAVSGDCYNISYFAYDENAEETENGTITSKLSSPNPNWDYYIKEYEMPYRNSYYIYDLSNDEMALGFDHYAGNISSLSLCNELKEEMSLGDDYECRGGAAKKYDLCVVEGENEYCLKIGPNTKNYNITLLNGIFGNENCFDFNDNYYCGSENFYIGIVISDDITTLAEAFLNNISCGAGYSYQSQLEGFLGMCYDAENNSGISGGVYKK